MDNLRDRLSRLKRPVIIGIAGDSGSGKTTYSNGIRKLLGIDLVQTISLDGYHRENRQQRSVSGRLPLDPGANRLELVLEHLKALKEAKTIELPIYNHGTGDFDSPSVFSPGPIVIVEGLHALYPEFLNYYDFKIFVDPSRDVKWEWKYKRDTDERHHEKVQLNREMLERETAYKRWIDFQKTNALAVVKIKPSAIRDLARHELLNEIPANCYKVELIMEPPDEMLSGETMQFDLPSLFSGRDAPFLLASVPSLYWGKRVSTVHIDGVVSEKTILELEKHIFKLTGIPVEEMLKIMPKTAEHEKLTGVQLAQLLIGWRFLEMLVKVTP